MILWHYNPDAPKFSRGFRQFFMANQAKAGAILRFLAKMG
jgi:hypothetical protein